MKFLWIVLAMVFLALSCNKEDKDISNPSITRIRYEIKNAYKDTLFFNLEYLLLSDVQQADSFKIIPGAEKEFFSLSYIAGTQPHFTCSDRLVSFRATNLRGDAMLKNDPLVPGWWKESMVPVSIDTFYLCSCTLDSTGIRICNYDGSYLCVGISQSWYEIPEIDSTLYWTDTSSVVLEITRGNQPDEVIIPLSNGTLRVIVNDDGKFSHSGAPPNIGTYFTSGIFIDPDSLSIESSGWVDMQYYHQFNWNGRRISK